MARKYFLDFEFSEGFRKPLSWLPTLGRFNKKQWFIEMISLGLTCEDGRQYYAINKDFHPSWANDWVKENVLTQLPSRYEVLTPAMFVVQPMGENEPRLVENVRPNPVYKDIKQIALDVFNFVNENTGNLPHEEFISQLIGDPAEPSAAFAQWKLTHNAKVVEDKQVDKASGVTTARVNQMFYAQPEFYGYFCDYDWVLFATMWGTMMQLPQGFPMYCRDTKQMLDDMVTEVTLRYFKSIEANKDIPFNRNRDEMWELNLKAFKENKDYPTNSANHNALADAVWIQNLFTFIQKYKPTL